MNVKFSTKFVAASAAAVMALSLAGCSGGSMDDSSSSSAKASGDSITIGTVTTNSGTAAAYGEAEVKGFELAVSEINAKGGINGKKVKLESMDDKGDATEASNAYNKLAGDNNVLAVAGMTFDGVTGKFTMDKSGSPTKSVTVLEMKDGKPVYNTTVQPK